MSTARMVRPAAGPAVRVKRLGRAAVDGVGLVTAGWRVAPTFLVVGTQRGGTTSLHRALSAHPAVLPPVAHKGVHFFDVAYPRGRDWYLAHFPLRRTAARAAARAGAGRAEVFESSPYYMFHPAGPRRIADTLPGVRAIVVLRDPAVRAHSQFAHERARGFEPAETFEEALALEPERTAGEEERLLADPGYVSHAHQHLAYVARSTYGPQLDRLAACLGGDRLLVLDHQDLVDAPDDVVARVQDFLGLVPHPAVSLGHHNARSRGELDRATRALVEDRLGDSDRIVARHLGVTPSWRR